MDVYEEASLLIRSTDRCIAFTGAGISVESGIPPFRGEDGLWSKHNPIFLDIDYFMKYPLLSWKKIKAIFYDFFGQARPNLAHQKLALLEQENRVQGIITQNIDNLHQDAGSREVIEFHGTAQTLACTRCGQRIPSSQIDLNELPPRCAHCDGILKPDFVFFGEPIPRAAHEISIREAEAADAFLVIGTTGEIMPASIIPHLAKSKGARIVEINIQPSRYTEEITDIFIQAKASSAMEKLAALLSTSP